ncbi:MAG: LPS assembly protein LptD [Marinibacterium sp.]|nr:LPS assembly protein LptD [Marinibacterium sp.]
MRRLFLICALVAIRALPAAAQTPEPATLVADRIELTEDGRLVAEGNVEAFHDGERLMADRIIYDSENRTVSIEGSLRLDTGSGAVILANSAELDTEFQQGVLRGAQIVFDQTLQLQSRQLDRVAGRYNQLYKVAATSCQVCENDDPPLWQIRARKVVHDEAEQQLYFENARLLVWDVPIAYIPRLRIPEPGVKRADGFLIPQVRTTSQLGTGFLLPYFKTLGDHADVTLTPYLSAETTTLNLRYRQAFYRGRIELDGAITQDSLRDDQPRGYLFASGDFDLENDFKFNFAIRSTSDNAYLKDYGISDTDRLASQITLTRAKRDSYLGFSAINYENLRSDAASLTTPGLIGDAFYQHRFFPTSLGGEVRVTADLHNTSRDSDVDALGRDVLRGTGEMFYYRDHVTPWGLHGAFEAGVSFDTFKIDDDDDFDDIVLRTTPATALTLRMPLTRRSEGTTQYLEPIFQVAWSNVIGEEVPNEESRFVEFDEGNLLALSRFPSPDRREEGLRMAYGLNWSRYGASPWQTDVSLGQILRSKADEDFSPTSGLAGTVSDLLLAGQLSYDGRFAVSGRTLIGSDFNFDHAELRGSWNSTRMNLSGSYIWLEEDIKEGRLAPVSEVWLDGFYRINTNWRARADIRYDIERSEPSYAGAALTYTNECVNVDVTLNRRFTESSDVEASTEFGFTIALRGFTAQAGTESYKRSCS